MPRFKHATNHLKRSISVSRHRLRARQRIIRVMSAKRTSGILSGHANRMMQILGGAKVASPRNIPWPKAVRNRCPIRKRPNNE